MINMKTRNKENKKGGRGRDLQMTRRKMLSMLETSRKKNLPEPFFVTCNPQTNNHSLQAYAKHNIEPELSLQKMILDSTDKGKKYTYIVGQIDKSAQNPINQLGDANGAGDQTMKLYFEEAKMATKRVAGINGSDNLTGFVMRVSDESDEGIIVIGGIILPEAPQVQFIHAMEMVYREVDLSKYGYSVTVGGERFDLDLLAFSEIFRNKNVVKACDFHISDPIEMDGRIDSGFITEQIRDLGYESIWFRDELPECFNIPGVGLPEVNNPFKTNLEDQKTERTESGTFVEIKYEIPDNIKPRLLGLVRDVRGKNRQLKKRGTRKGFAEIYGGLFGMRGMNTFLGKSITNGMMTTIAFGMMDLAKEGVHVVPVSRGHLKYWVGLPQGQDTMRMIEAAIRRRTNSGKNHDDYSYLDLSLQPKITCMDATGRDLSEVSAEFIINSIKGSMKDYPVSILDQSDFLVNFIEYVRYDIQQEILEKVTKNRTNNISKENPGMETIKMMRKICSNNKFIRDTEDFIWTLRDSDDVPKEIRTDRKRNELEERVFKFIHENYEKIRFHLTKKIEGKIRTR